ncbi:PREDICTED: vegetative cell wall protein gp1-like [Galeopterus variegatus]|uniref:Vegetative cell wall protein gp1-like n=1 Tax=Galeopterus variegatus TaxID=482537 RepID=A0ABM0PZ29_GALVR|nr:PREDICTED: vegetative cell wall protein gp1-like [Galeopterus variegatus]
MISPEHKAHEEPGTTHKPSSAQLSSSQLSSAQLSPAQPSPAQPSTAQTCSAQPSSAQPTSDQPRCLCSESRLLPSQPPLPWSTRLARIPPFRV